MIIILCEATSLHFELCKPKKKCSIPKKFDAYLSGVGGLHVGRLQGHVGEGHLHGVLDGVEKLHDHVGDVLEAQLPPLGGTKSGPDL